MSKGALSQDEIDRLLSTSEDQAGNLTTREHELLASYSNVFREALSHVIGQFTGGKVEAEWTGTERLKGAEALPRLSDLHACFPCSLTQGLKGRLLLCIPVPGALDITRAMGVEGDTLEDMQRDALLETGNLLFAQAHDRLAKQVGMTIANSAPQIEVGNPDGKMLTKHLGSDSMVILAEFNIKGVSSKTFRVCLLTSSDLLLSLKETQGDERAKPSSGSSFKASPASPPPGGSASDSVIRPAQFEEFSHGQTASEPRNLDLLLDVSLSVRVELGRTTMKIQDILELGTGSVVELDKLAGEPVDLLVNDKLFARGEVVVIDESFGVRITDIVSLSERVHALH